jgi:hypothetical protein
MLLSFVGDFDLIARFSLAWILQTGSLRCIGQLTNCPLNFRFEPEFEPGNFIKLRTPDDMVAEPETSGSERLGWASFNGNHSRKDVNAAYEMGALPAASTSSMTNFVGGANEKQFSFDLALWSFSFGCSRDSSRQREREHPARLACRA